MFFTTQDAFAPPRIPAFARSAEGTTLDFPTRPQRAARLQMIRAGKQLQCVIPQVQQI